MDAADLAYTKSLAGALLIAAFINWGLLGVLGTQCYSYYLAFPRDRLLAKILVYLVLALEAAQTALISHDVYITFVNSYGEPSIMDNLHLHWVSIPVSGGISGGIGQLFFAYRIYLISGSLSKGTPAIIGTLALASVISAGIASDAFFRAKTFSALLNTDDNSDSLPSIGVWNGIGAICDITIALTMPYYLMRHGTGMRSTHVMIVKLVRLIIETGGLTAIIALLHLCLYFSNDKSFIIAGLTISKIYANTLLVLLNNRMKIVDGRDSDFHTHSDDQESHMFRHASRDTAPRQTSTIYVSGDRMVVRLHDLPSSPKSLAPSTPKSIATRRSADNVSADTSTHGVKIQKVQTMHFDDIPPVPILHKKDDKYENNIQS